MLKLHVGDVPLKPLLINVNREGLGVDLSTCTVALRLVSPEGSVISTTAGSFDLGQAAQGKVKYLWPSTTLFTSPGEYKVQLVVTKGSAVEYTSPGILDVYRV